MYFFTKTKFFDFHSEEAEWVREFSNVLAGANDEIVTFYMKQVPS